MNHCSEEKAWNSQVLEKYIRAGVLKKKSGPRLPHHVWYKTHLYTTLSNYESHCRFISSSSLRVQAAYLLLCAITRSWTHGFLNYGSSTSILLLFVAIKIRAYVQKSFRINHIVSFQSTKLQQSPRNTGIKIPFSYFLFHLFTAIKRVLRGARGFAVTFRERSLCIWLSPKLIFDSGSVQIRPERHHIDPDYSNQLWHHDADIWNS